MKTNLALALFSTFTVRVFLPSCEGQRCGSGRVVGKATNRPLDSVLCEVVTGTETIYTDSGGRFKLCNPFGKCVPACKDVTLRFSKAGYKSLSVENPANKTIYLEG